MSYYIDKSGAHSGYSITPQPALGLIDEVEIIPAQPVIDPQPSADQIKAALASAGMTSAQLDALFTAAALLQA